MRPCRPSLRACGFRKDIKVERRFGGKEELQQEKGVNEKERVMGDR